MSTHGEMHQPQPGCGQPSISDGDHRSHNKSAAGTIAGNRNAVWFETPTQEIAISSNGILDRGGKGMFGRKTIIQRQGPATGCPTGLRDEMAMAVQRANNVSAAV